MLILLLMVVHGELFLAHFLEFDIWKQEQCKKKELKCLYQIPWRGKQVGVIVHFNIGSWQGPHLRHSSFIQYFLFLASFSS